MLARRKDRVAGHAGIGSVPTHHGLVESLGGFGVARHQLIPDEGAMKICHVFSPCGTPGLAVGGVAMGQKSDRCAAAPRPVTATLAISLSASAETRRKTSEAKPTRML